jgi:hypothetical protein
LGFATAKLANGSRPLAVIQVACQHPRNGKAAETQVDTGEAGMSGISVGFLVLALFFVGMLAWGVNTGRMPEK